MASQSTSGTIASTSQLRDSQLPIQCDETPAVIPPRSSSSNHRHTRTNSESALSTHPSSSIHPSTPELPQDPFHPGRALPQGWKKLIHLDGGVYFFNKELKLVTQDNIEDDGVEEDVLKFREDHLGYLEDKGLLQQMPEDSEMYIYGTQEPGLGGGLSHFMSLEKDIMFYFPVSRGIDYNSRVSFWWELENTPMHRERLPHNAETDFLSALSHGANERVFGHKNSIFPFTDQQAERLVQIYRALKDRQLQAGEDGKKFVPALAWHIGRVMYEIEQARIRYKYGTRDVVINLDKTIPPRTWKLWLLDMALLFLSFGAHTTYRKRLQRIRGLKLYLPDYGDMIQHLLVEWADSNLLATVFVASNVAYLAIPGINEMQRTASLASAVFAITSIVSGVHHVWQHRGKTNVEFDDADKYLEHVDFFSKEFNLTVTACFLSLPIVSLLWSVVSFTVAVAAYCYEDSDVRGEILLAIVLGGCGVLATCMLSFFWHIWKVPRSPKCEAKKAKGVGKADDELKAHPMTWLHFKKWGRGEKGIIAGDAVNVGKENGQLAGSCNV